MFEISIDIKGLHEIIIKTENLGEKIFKEAYLELIKTCQDSIETKAKELCPIGHTGALKNSIITIPMGINYPIAEVIVRAGGPSAPYAEAVEYGWVMTPEQFRAMARKKGKITPKLAFIPEAMTSRKKFIPPRHFMADARNYGIPIILDRMEKKIKELTR